MNAQGGTIVYVDANGQLNLYRSSTDIRIDEIITYGAGSFVVSPNGQYCAYLDLALNIYKNGESRRIAIEGRGSTLLSISNDGSTVYFVDTSSGNLYAKTFDFNTGKAPVVSYVRENIKPVQYATVDDLNALRSEIEALRKKEETFRDEHGGNDERGQ